MLSFLLSLLLLLFYFSSSTSLLLLYFSSLTLFSSLLLFYFSYSYSSSTSLKLIIVCFVSILARAMQWFCMLISVLFSFHLSGSLSYISTSAFVCRKCKCFTIGALSAFQETARPLLCFSLLSYIYLLFTDPKLRYCFCLRREKDG
jgi:hypothetical protein